MTGALVKGAILLVCDLSNVTGALEAVIYELCVLYLKSHYELVQLVCSRKLLQLWVIFANVAVPLLSMNHTQTLHYHYVTISFSMQTHSTSTIRFLS